MLHKIQILYLSRRHGCWQNPSIVGPRPRTLPAPPETMRWTVNQPAHPGCSALFHRSHHKESGNVRRSLEVEFCGVSAGGIQEQQKLAVVMRRIQVHRTEQSICHLFSPSFLETVISLPPITKFGVFTVWVVGDKLFV